MTAVRKASSSGLCFSGPGGLIEGEVRVTVDDRQLVLGPGDTVVLPAGAERQLSAQADAQLVVCGRGDAIARVPGEAAPRGTPPWIG